MTSRFEIVDKGDIEELKGQERKWKHEEQHVFNKWANGRRVQANLEEYNSDVLDQTLSKFDAFRNSVILTWTQLSAGHEISLLILRL